MVGNEIHNHGPGAECVPSCPGNPMRVPLAPNYSWHQKAVIESMEQSTQTYKERSKVYKDNYAMVGRVMVALFPEGAPALKTEEDFNRWHIFELMIVKITRYVSQWNDGHHDSLVDEAVYAHILAAIDGDMLMERSEAAAEQAEIQLRGQGWGDDL